MAMLNLCWTISERASTARKWEGPVLLTVNEVLSEGRALCIMLCVCVWVGGWVHVHVGGWVWVGEYT